MLTRKQHELICFIADRLAETGVSPSFEEMKEALDLKSKSGVHRLISALEEREFIRRLPNRARALEVLRMPERGEAKKPASPKNTAPVASTSSTSATPPAPANDVVEIPLHGRIAAGTPIEALQNRIADVPVPGGMIGRGDHYALEVTGDSMINAGILDGDTVIIQEADSANTGEIVVALVDDNEATLKRLRRRGDSIALEAANPAYETRLYGADRVKVQGKLVGLIRRY